MSGKKTSSLLFKLYLLVLFLPCLEIALRIVGYEPYRRSAYSLSAEPAFCILPDAQLGFALHPGRFQVTINDALTYTATHGPDSLRISRSQPLDSVQEEIYLMGCSYAYGMGVDDSLSLGWRLQQALPQQRIRNFARPGFGNIQSFLQLKRQLKKDQKPTFVVVLYADFHDARNVLLPVYRRHLHIGFERANPILQDRMVQSRMPYVRQHGEQIEIHWLDWREMYADWPGRQDVALINLGQDIKDYWDSHQIEVEHLNLWLFQEMQKLCDQHNVPLLVAALTQNEATEKRLRELSKLGIANLDISLDLRDSVWTHHPVDSHPNAAAHAHYAAQLSDFLLKRLNLQ
ncbi:MAG: hypothetical protein AAF206_18935 [Bacteroidota bacterium]